MTEKFNVGDKVYDILRGVGKVVKIDSETAEICDVVEVLFNSRTYSETYSQKGFWHNSYANPTLLTIPEARAKGYDVPKEMMKKTLIRYGLLYSDIGISGIEYDCKEAAESHARSVSGPPKVMKITREWEEEI